MKNTHKYLKRKQTLKRKTLKMKINTTSIKNNDKEKTKQQYYKKIKWGNENEKNKRKQKHETKTHAKQL